MDKRYSRTEFSRLAGVTTRTLLRWEKAGTLVSLKTPGGRAVYTDAHLEMLALPQAGSLSAHSAPVTEDQPSVSAPAHNVSADDDDDILNGVL